MLKIYMQHTEQSIFQVHLIVFTSILSHLHTLEAEWMKTFFYLHSHHNINKIKFIYVCKVYFICMKWSRDRIKVEGIKNLIILMLEWERGAVPLLYLWNLIFFFCWNYASNFLFTMVYKLHFLYTKTIQNILLPVLRE